jgi:hypothetical protein
MHACGLGCPLRPNLGPWRASLVVFKHEDEQPDGTPIGPVWIDYFGDDPKTPQRSEQLDEWVTLADSSPCRGIWLRLSGGLTGTFAV